MEGAFINGLMVDNTLESILRARSMEGEFTDGQMEHLMMDAGNKELDMVLGLCGEMVSRLTDFGKTIR